MTKQQLHRYPASDISDLSCYKDYNDDLFIYTSQVDYENDVVWQKYVSK